MAGDCYLRDLEGQVVPMRVAEDKMTATIAAIRP